MPGYEMVVGLEVHVQLATKTKLFCACPADGSAAPPNSRICPLCTGQPGTLPVLNRSAVELAFQTALALNCRIAPVSVFARKSYFYPDLPKAYQISQYERPFATDGWLELPGGEVPGKRIRIRRIPLESVAPGAVIDGPSIFEADLGDEVDNMEGIVIGSGDIGILSNNNGRYASDTRA